MNTKLTRRDMLRLSAIGGYEMEYMASFTGFVPADDPEFAITVMVLRPDKSIGYYGGVVIKKSRDRQLLLKLWR